MPPTTSSVTSGCALSYSAATFLKVMSSLPALQPTQTVSFVGDAWRVPPATVAATRPTRVRSAAALTTRFIPPASVVGLRETPLRGAPTPPVGGGQPARFFLAA